MSNTVEWYVYSYNLRCVKCDDFRYGWVKFIAAAFLPLKIFYLLVTLFRISATSSALNGYVLVSQLVATPTILRHTYSFNHVISHSHSISYESQHLIDSAIAMYAVWNLDFFRSFYNPICLHPSSYTPGSAAWLFCCCVPTATYLYHIHLGKTTWQICICGVSLEAIS